MPKTIYYGRTPIGQLLWDLAFTELDRSYIARKHSIPVAMIDRMRESPEVVKLRKKVKADRRKARHG